MVNGATTRGYWRTNPDGTRDWIETNAPVPTPDLEQEDIVIDEAARIEAERQRLAGVPLPEQLPGVPAVEVAPPVPVVPLPPGVPEVDVTDVAGQFGLDAGAFVSSVQLADLALPPEERLRNWRIPFEQFLTSEQARFLGFDVPEGSVVRMTPMAEGEPAFFLVDAPGAPVDNTELIASLRTVYPDFFDPKNSFGIPLDDLPQTIVDGLRENMATDYPAFVEDLYKRTSPEIGEQILRLLGVTEENILLTLGVKEQEVRVNTMIDTVFPGFTADELTGLVESDWPLFIETMQTGGSSNEKRALLQYMGWNPDEINRIFSTVRLTLPVDGVRQLLTIDVPSMRAFDQEGRWVGSYNVVTGEFTENPEEDWVKDVWDAFVLGGQNLIHQGKQFLVSSLPEFLFRDLTEVERSLYGDEYVNKVNAVNAVHRDRFRRVYARNERINDEWIAAHPELAPPEWATGNIVDRLRDDPLKAILYEFATTAPFMIAVMGTTIGVTALTGNPLAGVAAGATEQQAGLLSLPIGLAMSAIETVGDLPYLKQMFPTLFKAFSKGIGDEISKLTLNNLLKKGLRTFTTAEITEALEEVMQDAVLNAGIRTFDENQGIFEGWNETALRTLVATLPIAAFGGAGTALQRVSPTELAALSPERKAELNVQQDPETGNWYQPFELPAVLSEFLKGERGAIGKPAEVLKKLPTEGETALYKELQADGASKGLSVEAIQGIAEGEYWVAVTPKTGGKDALSDWITSFADKGVDVVELRRRVEGKFPKRPGTELDVERGFRNRGRFLPFTTLEDAKRFIETGDLEAVAKSITLRGTPWTAEQLAASREGLEGTLAPALPGAPAVSAAVPEAVSGVEAVARAYPLAGDVVDGRTIRMPIPNQDSIAATFEEYEVLDGIREVPLTAFTETTPPTQRPPLADEIEQSGEITPLIVAIDKNGAYILEGGHRYDALLSLGAKSFPAQVVLDTESIGRAAAAPPPVPERAPAPPPEAKPAEAKASEKTKSGKPVNFTEAEKEETRRVFAAYISSPDAVAAWNLTRQLRREARTQRVENMKARAQVLMVDEGLSSEEAVAKAISETMTGELPMATAEYTETLTDRMRLVLFDKVWTTLKDDEFELMSTHTALTNALAGRPIPRTPGARGGSAYTRLARVFGEEAGVLEAIDKIAKERKPLKRVVEEIYEHVGNPAVPIDQATLDYLRDLGTVGVQEGQMLDVPGAPRGRVTFEPTGKLELTEQGQQFMLGEGPYEPLSINDMRTAADLEFAAAELKLGRQFAEGKLDADQYQQARFDARDKAYPIPPPVAYPKTISDAVETVNMWPAPVRDQVVKVLREIGMSPVDIGNFFRANLASFDMSFWRQQAPLIASHPISFAMANVEAWKATFSQKAAEASWERITRDPIFQIYEDAAAVGGDFLRPLIKRDGTAQWQGTEEFGYLTGERLIPRLTGKLWWVKISGRAFETGTNEHNWLIFKNYYRAMQRLGEDYASGKKKLKPFETFDIEKEMVAFAKSLANFTARGSLGRLAPSAPALSSIFFAPRAAIGRILSVADLVNANPRVRREAWKNAFAFVGLFGGLIMAGAAVGWWEYEDDPRSAEYMSIRVGNTRIDPWGGFRQLLVFIARVTTQTGISSVTGAEYEVDPWTAFTKFARGKSAPLISAIIDFSSGRNFIGEEVDVTDWEQWAERVAPFALQDIYEAWMEDPITGIGAALPAFFGAGVQTYTGDWRENWQKLGLAKYSDNFEYGMVEPVYDTADFWTDTSSQFAGVDPATLTEEKGFPEQIRSIAEARVINENLKLLPNEKLASLNADPNLKEPTFTQYRKMWQDREALVAAGKEAEFTVRELQEDGTYKTVVHKGDEAVTAFDRDERTRKANLGNMSQRQFSLLSELAGITDDVERDAFIELHEADIGVNARREWLVSHPEDNAKLAIWGQAKILTRAAYDEFNRLVAALDIPGSALPPLSLPPEESVDDYFAREDAVAEFGGSSAESVLVLAQNPDLLAWYQEEARRAGGDPLADPEFPVSYYELKVKNRGERERWGDLGDKEHDDYIEDIDERRASLYREFPETEYFDDDARTEAIANRFSDSEIEEWVERDRLVRADSAGSPLVKQWAFDNPDAYRAALEEGLLKDRGGLATEEQRGHYDEWVEPAVRLQAKNVEEDGYWQLLGDKQSPETYIDDEAARRTAFFKKFPDSVYFDDLERIEAYKEGFTETEADLWAARGRLTGTVDEQSAEAKLWLVDHDGVWQKAQAAGMITDDGSDWNVPALRILAQWRAQYDEMAGLATDDEKLAYRAERDDFRLDWHRRKGLMLKNKATGAVLAERYIEDYVEYQELGAKGKRQERFLIDNPEYATAISAVTGLTIPPADEVPAAQYDDIYDENLETFEQIERYKDNESDDFIPAGQDRDDAVAALRFDEDGKYTEFGLAEVRRNGYGKFVSEEHIDAYVGYYKIIGEGKPENWKLNIGTDLWYDDDWYLIDNIDFYNDVYVGLQGNEAKDFSKIPTRDVFTDYIVYLQQPHLTAKDAFRDAHPDLDAWLVLKFGYTPIAQKRRRAGLSSYERFIEDWDARGARIDEELRKQRGE